MCDPLNKTKQASKQFVRFSKMNYVYQHRVPSSSRAVQSRGEKIEVMKMARKENDHDESEYNMLCSLFVYSFR